jgi:hypothetical protein
MRVCILTQDEAVSALVREGVKGATAVDILSNGDQLIESILLPGVERPRFVFIDLIGTTDGVRALDFIKSSPTLGRIRIVAIAHLGDSENLADAVLHFPFSADDVAELVTRLSQQGRW